MTTKEKYPPLLIQQHTVFYCILRQFIFPFFFLILRNILGILSVLGMEFSDMQAWKHGIPPLGVLHNQLVALRWPDVILTSQTASVCESWGLTSNPNGCGAVFLSLWGCLVAEFIFFMPHNWAKVQQKCQGT